MTLFNESRKAQISRRRRSFWRPISTGRSSADPKRRGTRLYDWIEENRASVGLIFVTGRDPGFIRNLTRKGNVPRPDYVVGDVGTTIAAVDEDHS
jgi:hypothetical protein